MRTVSQSAGEKSLACWGWGLLKPRGALVAPGTPVAASLRSINHGSQTAFGWTHKTSRPDWPARWGGPKWTHNGQGWLTVNAWAGAFVCVAGGDSCDGAFPPPAGKPVCFTTSVKIKELSAALFLLGDQNPHPPYAFHVVSRHDRH